MTRFVVIAALFACVATNPVPVPGNQTAPKKAQIHVGPVVVPNPLVINVTAPKKPQDVPPPHHVINVTEPKKGQIHIGQGVLPQVKVEVVQASKAPDHKGPYNIGPEIVPTHKPIIIGPPKHHNKSTIILGPPQDPTHLPIVLGPPRHHKPSAAPSGVSALPDAVAVAVQAVSSAPVFHHLGPPVHGGNKTKVGHVHIEAKPAAPVA